jgi:general secretion pathway protein G
MQRRREETEMRDEARTREPRDEGFSFIEIMAVVIIIGMLTALVANNIFSRLRQAEHKIARAQIEKVAGQLELYRVDNGMYPTTEQGLEALVSAPTSDPQPRNWLPGGYAKAADLKDPWQNALQYRVPGEHNAHSFDLFSYGADGVEGGEGVNADVTNWDSGA